MALGKASEVKEQGKRDLLSNPSRRYSASKMIAEGDTVRLEFKRSPLCGGVEDPPLNQKGRVNPGSENRLDMVCGDSKTYSDYRLYWMVYWVNRLSFDDLSPMRAMNSEVLFLPDSIVALDMIEGRK